MESQVLSLNLLLVVFIDLNGYGLPDAIVAGGSGAVTIIMD